MNDPKLVEALIKTAEGLKGQCFEENVAGPKETLAPHLLWMIDQIVANAPTWPVDKTGRWIGFVQGVLTTRGYLNVKAERDRTRPLFHAAYGKDAPPTLEKE